MASDLPGARGGAQRTSSHHPQALASRHAQMLLDQGRRPLLEITEEHSTEAVAHFADDWGTHQPGRVRAMVGLAQKWSRSGWTVPCTPDSKQASSVGKPSKPLAAFAQSASGSAPATRSVSVTLPVGRHSSPTG